MSDYVLSPRAQRDIADIWDFTASRWNLQQAEAYVRQIQVTIELVAAKPEIAHSCDHIRPGYWKYRAGSHVLYFRRTEGGIDIIRILHGGMDFEQHL